MFSASHPGELVVTAQIPGQPDITAPSVILCAPAAGERVIDVKVLKLACASEDTALISAWVVPRTANEVSCTAPPPHPRSADAPQSSDAVALARAVVPVSIATMDPSTCKDGSISFAVTLAPRDRRPALAADGQKRWRLSRSASASRQRLSPGIWLTQSWRTWRADCQSPAFW